MLHNVKLKSRVNEAELARGRNYYKKYSIRGDHFIRNTIYNYILHFCEFCEIARKQKLVPSNFCLFPESQLFKNKTNS